MKGGPKIQISEDWLVQLYDLQMSVFFQFMLYQHSFIHLHVYLATSNFPAGTFISAVQSLSIDLISTEYIKDNVPDNRQVPGCNCI